jgi:hypothetical protein
MIAALGKYLLLADGKRVESKKAIIPQMRLNSKPQRHQAAAPANSCLAAG